MQKKVQIVLITLSTIEHSNTERTTIVYLSVPVSTPKKPELSFCFHKAIFGILLMLSPKVSFIYGYYSISFIDKLNIPPHF